MPTIFNTATYTDSALIESSNTLSRKVIVNVDDLGLSEPVNHAVINLAKKRLITAASYMVGGNIDVPSIKTLQLLNVEVGLHLDFTELIETGLPMQLSKLIKDCYLRRIDSNTVTEVIKQQLDLFEDKFNHAPRFIDGHQHVHQFPIIRHCLTKELVSRYGNKIIHTPVRVTRPVSINPKAYIINSLGGQKWQKMCKQHHIPTNDYFGGVYNFQADTASLEKLWDNWLKNSPIGLGGPIKTALIGMKVQPNKSPVTLIMCHPAIPEDNWINDIKRAREREYEWMISGRLKKLYDKNFVELTHWRDIYK